MKENENRESFVSRWSRLKQETRGPAREKSAAPDAAAQSKKMPELPPVDGLTPESDFSSFMDSRVDDAIRRVALKKLFRDPRFNVTDGLDDYAEDYSALEKLSAAAVDRLEHVRRALRGVNSSDAKPSEPRALKETATSPVQTGQEPPAADTQSGSEDGGPQEGSAARDDGNG